MSFHSVAICTICLQIFSRAEMDLHGDVAEHCQLLLDKMFSQKDVTSVNTEFELPAQQRGFNELTSLLTKCISFGNYIFNLNKETEIYEVISMF